MATELDLEVDEVPASIDLAADLAAEVCGVDVGALTDSCVAVMSNASLVAAIEDEEDADHGNNSAREFAPGQQEGPAVESAPGQQEGDAQDFAPGQLKQDSDDAGRRCEDSGDDA